jgi:hypothetical protein
LAHQLNDCPLPDGTVVDVEAGHTYWTSMGVLKLNDGSIERADLEGRNRKTIIPVGRPAAGARSSSLV